MPAVPAGGTVIAVLQLGRRLLPEVSTTDAVVAISIFALGQAEAWGAVVGGQPAAAAVTLAVGTLPLAWRRHWPLGVAALVGLSLLVGAALDVGVESLAQLVAVLVAMYTAGALLAIPLAALALPTMFACAAVSVTTSDQGGVSDLVFAGLVVVAPWTVGRVARRLDRRAHAHHARAERLEQDQDRLAREAAADERRRIARELHDIVAHSVSVMVVQAGGAEELVEASPEQARAAMRSVRETGQQALAEMRRMVGLLRINDDEPTGLAPQPRLTQLDELVTQAGASGLATVLRVEGTPRPLPPGADLSAYRIVQEALTNARRHATAATAQVTVRWATDEVVLEIIDDGTGTEGTGSRGRGPAGHGLLGMRERAALFGGVVTAGPEPGGGYAVRAHLPTEPTEP
jgi:signal transduction histidine kinase